MRNVLKAATLERKFPILAVENDCIVSKDGEVTIAFRVELPEVFSVTGEEYESIHAAWVKGINLLPNYSILHKQDWFIQETYVPETHKEDQSFLSLSFERHFNERPYLYHTCYLFLTKTRKERTFLTSNYGILTRGNITPREIQHPETVTAFLECVSQFCQILNETGFIRLTRLSAEEIIGTENSSGILEKYLSLSQRNTTSLEDITLGPGEMKVGDKYLNLHTLSYVEDLPVQVGTDIRYDKYSTDKSDCRLSFAAPVGLLLNCNHIYNQYVFVDDPKETLRRFEKSSRNMQSLSQFSRSNQINSEWVELFLNEAHAEGLTNVRCHCNVLAWSENRDELRHIKNEVGSALAFLDCKPRHNTVDLPALFWAGIPGNAGDFPFEESFHTFTEQAVCFMNQETQYKSSPSTFGIKMVDRLTGKPIFIDISDLPMRLGICTSRNKFILGPSGSGKSFFCNHLIRQYYEQGAHILLIDTGNSYQGLCQFIHKKTRGKDGIYFTYTEEKPISFNPFYTDDGLFDIEKRESIKTLILALWKSEFEAPTRAEEVALSNAITLYLRKLAENNEINPCFNTFYEFIKEEYTFILEEKKVREKDFDIHNFLNVLEPFYKGGEYDYLLNSDQELDLLSKRFIVFELDNIKDHKILFTVVTIIIMESFINKMRKLKGIRKLFVLEEAWKALTKEGMASYIKYLYKTVRKHFGEIITITQEIDDLLSSEIVKESIINNSDCKILLDQRKYLNKFDSIQALLGLTEKEKAQILSLNQSNHVNRKYKEVWISLGGTHSSVYATEVSLEEYYAYTTEETEKLELYQLVEERGGNIELAIKQLAERKRTTP